MQDADPASVPFLLFLRRLARSPLSSDGAALRDPLLDYHSVVSKWLQEQSALQTAKGKRPRAGRSSNRDIKRHQIHWTLGVPKDDADGHMGAKDDKQINVGDEYQADVPQLDPAARQPVAGSALTERETGLCGSALPVSESCTSRAVWPAADRRQMEQSLYRATRKDFFKVKEDGLGHLSTADIVDYYYNHWKPSPGHSKFLRWQATGAKPPTGTANRRGGGRRRGGRAVGRGRSG